MSALAKLQPAAIHDGPKLYKAPPPRIMAQVIPFVLPAPATSSKNRWWIPLGLIAFLTGLFAALCFMDNGPASLRTIAWPAHALISDLEADDNTYVETINPPPSNIVVPVPVMPTMPGLSPQSSGGLGEYSAGIPLPAPGLVPDWAGEKLVTVVDKKTAHDGEQMHPHGANLPAENPLLDDAQAQLDEGNDLAAVAIYDRLLGTDKNNPAALAGKAFALQMLGQYEEAANVGRRLVKLTPKDQDAKINFVTALGSWGSKEAVKELQHISARKPGFAAAQAALALALARQGNALEALPHVRRAIQAEPDNNYYQLDLAIVYDQLGHTGEAIEIYQKVLEVYDNSEELPQALPQSISSVRERLEYLQGMLDKANNLAGG